MQSPVLNGWKITRVIVPVQGAMRFGHSMKAVADYFLVDGKPQEAGGYAITPCVQTYRANTPQF